MLTYLKPELIDDTKISQYSKFYVLKNLFKNLLFQKSYF